MQGFREMDPTLKTDDVMDLKGEMKWPKICKTRA
jgi:hypothetical protein